MRTRLRDTANTAGGNGGNVRRTSNRRKHGGKTISASQKAILTRRKAAEAKKLALINNKSPSSSVSTIPVSNAPKKRNRESSSLSSSPSSEEDDDSSTDIPTRSNAKRAKISKSASNPKKKNKSSLKIAPDTTILPLLNGKTKKISVTGPGVPLAVWYNTGYYMLFYMLVASIEIDVSDRKKSVPGGKKLRPSRVSKSFLSGIRPVLCYVAHTGHLPTYSTEFDKKYLKNKDSAESVFFTQKGSCDMLIDSAKKYYQGRFGVTQNFGRWYSNLVYCWKRDKLWGPGTKFKLPPEESYHAYLPYCSMMQKHHLLPFQRGSSTIKGKKAAITKNT